MAEETPSWPRALARGLASAGRRGLGRDDEVDGSAGTVSVAFLANLVVAAAKYIGFLLAGSSSLLAEAFHSTAVPVNQGVLLRGNISAQRPESPQHPFGHGPERCFWAFVVAIAIFGIGSVLSIGRGVLALTGSGHHAITQPVIIFAALSVGLLMGGWSFVVAAKQSYRDKGTLSYWQYVRQARDPEIPVVLGEDSAAMVGLLFAYLGVALTLVTGNEVFDAIASILIGLLLTTVSFILAREMKGLLVGAPATPSEAEQIDSVLADEEAVRDVVYVRACTWAPRTCSWSPRWCSTRACGRPTSPPPSTGWKAASGTGWARQGSSRSSPSSPNAPTSRARGTSPATAGRSDVGCCAGAVPAAPEEVRRWIPTRSRPRRRRARAAGATTSLWPAG